MIVNLKPDAEKFVEEQVRSGRFQSANELFNAAVFQMMVDAGMEMDDQTVAAINRAEEQIDEGKGIDFDPFAAEMRKRIATR